MGQVLVGRKQVQVCMEWVQVQTSVEVHKVLVVVHMEQEVGHKAPDLPQEKGLQIQQQSEETPTHKLK